MVVIFASRHPTDPHLELLKQELELINEEFIVLDPHHLEVEKPNLVQNGTDVTLTLRGRKCKPKSFFLSTQWRHDCILDTPDGFPYPQIFRARVLQFLQDIRFVFRNLPWYPGRIEEIERSESKVGVFAIANNIGLPTPSFTANAYSESVPQYLCDKPLYRKQLGFPFTISLNSKKRTEVGVTVVNEIISPASIDHDGSPWQWQEPLVATLQVRCVVTKDKVWNSCWDRSDTKAYMDFRLINQSEKDEIYWQPFRLSPEMVQGLQELNHRLNISHSCPELIVTESGRIVLIDLNPCGDWYGFFSEDVHREIAQTLAKICAKDN